MPLFEAVLDLLLPVSCVGCGVGHSQLCGPCRGLLAAAEPRRARPSHAPPGLPEVYAALPYGGAVRQLLLAHKERGALRLAAPLGSLLAEAVRTAFPAAEPARPLLLVPMPSTAPATRARGHDPMARLARAAARTLRAAGVPARAVPALRHVRRVADQSGLDPAARLRNLRGALTVPKPRAGSLRSGHVLLVDDILTTGASLAEAARALGEAQADVLAAAVVATAAR